MWKRRECFAFALLAAALGTLACQPELEEGTVPEPYLPQDIQQHRNSPEAEVWRAMARVGEEEGGARWPSDGWWPSPPSMTRWRWWRMR